MAKEVEIERLVTRLTGDASSYLRMVEEAAATTNRLTVVSQHLAQVEALVNQRLNEVAQAKQEVANAASRLAAMEDTVNRRMEEAARRSDELEQQARELAQAQTLLQRNTASAARSVESLSDRFSRAGKTITATGAAITTISGGLAASGLLKATTYEQTALAFEVMIGDVQEAQAVLANLIQFAAETPFELPEILQAARGLVMFGERGDELMRTLKIVGNAAAGTSSNFGELALIFNQVRGVGKLITQDFRQLSTRGVLSLQDIAKYYGVTTEAAQRMLSDGKITFNELRNILESLSKPGGRFADMMLRQSKTLGGLWSTLKDNVNEFAKALGQQLLPFVKSVVERILSLVNVLNSLSPTTKSIIAYTLGVIAILGTLLTVIGGLVFAFSRWIAIIGPVIAFIRGLSLATIAGEIAFKAYNLACNAVAAAQLLIANTALIAKAALIAGVGYAVYQLTSWLTGATEASQRFNDSLQRMGHLNSQFLGLERDRTEKTLKEAKGMAPEQRKQFLGSELSYAEKELQDANQQLELAKKRADELAPSWLSLWQAGKAEHQLQLEMLKQHETRITALRERVKAYKDELGKMTPEQKYQEALESLQEYSAKLQEQIDLFGLQGRELEIARLRREGVTEAELMGVKAKAQELEALEAAKKKEEEFKEKVEKRLQVLHRQIATAHLSERQRRIEELVADGVNRKHAEEIALLEEKAKALENERQKREQLANSVANYLEKLNEEIETFGMSSREAEIYRLKKQGASEADIGRARHLSAQLEALEKAKKLADEGKQLTEKYRTPSEKFAEEKRKLDEMLRYGAITTGVYTKALREAEEQAHKDYTARFRVSGLEGLQAGTAAARAALEEYRLGATRLPRVAAQKQEESQWKRDLEMPLSAGLVKAVSTPGEKTMTEKYLEALVDLARQKWKEPTVEIGASDL